MSCPATMALFLSLYFIPVLSALRCQDLNSELKQHHEDLDTLEHLAVELSSCGFAAAAGFPQHQERVLSLRKDFGQLQKTAKER